MQETIYNQLRSIVSESNGDNVFVIGKGPSVDNYLGRRFPNGLTITINDAEKVVRGDIAICTGNFVASSLLRTGFSCKLYLTGTPLPAYVNHIILPDVPQDLRDDDYIVRRLQSNVAYNEAFGLLNAIKIALIVSSIRGRKQKVYLLGFDFSTESGAQSSWLGADLGAADIVEREAVVHAQENDFRQVYAFLANDSRVEIHHVGNREFSRLIPSAFLRNLDELHVSNARGSESAEQATHVTIVAELTNNHLGDKSRLVEMIERVKDSGADLIKVQKRDVTSFYTKDQLSSFYWSPFGTTLEEYRRGVELSEEMLVILDETCKNVGIKWFSSVLDKKSFEILRPFDMPMIKVPSTISKFDQFHDFLSSNYFGPIVISTGYTAETYGRSIVQKFRKCKQIYLLHCVSAYPTPPQECNLAVVRSYLNMSAQNLAIIPGYSSHDIGSLGCSLAVAAGARMIEKHVKLGDVSWVHFDKVAVDLRGSEFAKFVKDIRNVEKMMGSETKRILSCETHKYEPPT